MQRVGDRYAVIDPVMVVHEACGIHYERVAFVMADGFAVESADDDVGVSMRAAVEIDDANGVQKSADHVDRGGLLDHGDGPDAGHDDGQAGGPALTDVIVIGLAFFARFLRGVVLDLRGGRELEVGRRGELERIAGASAVLPGSGDIERGGGTGFV